MFILVGLYSDLLPPADYHTNVILPDISANNILINIEDESILRDFVNDEMTHPAPRKFIDGKTIYASRGFGLPKVYGMAALSDFGSAVNGDETRHHNAQPDFFRAPEVMIKADWSYAVDIWNVGVLVSVPTSPLLHPVQLISARFGTFSRTVSCSKVKIPLVRGTRLEHISQSLLVCWVRLLEILFSEDGKWKSSLTRTVS